MSMAVDIASVQLIPTVVMGALAGVTNLVFMLMDETGSGKNVIGHGISAFFLIFVFTFFSMNINTIPQLLPNLQGTFFANEIAMRVIILLIATIYVHGHSSLFKGARGAGTKETWLHSLVVGGVVALAPYLWMIVGPLLPAEWSA
tara:strand:- start:25 stop:459 length:435 start_codon:yes stop_codon:yes gene_type:complete